MSPTVVFTWASATRNVLCSSVTSPVLPDAAWIRLGGDHPRRQSRRSLGRCLAGRVAEQPLHHDVLPLAIEAPVSAMSSNHAPATCGDERDAGLVGTSRWTY